MIKRKRNKKTMLEEEKTLIGKINKTELAGRK